MEKLTDKQNVILQILKKLIAKNGYPPTVREIGEEAHLSSPATIHFHLKLYFLKFHRFLYLDLRLIYYIFYKIFLM